MPAICKRPTSNNPCLSPHPHLFSPPLLPTSLPTSSLTSDCRYLELVEFCVALLQAPAESVTQSVVYAQQNLMGNGMYMNHALFIASIVFSLGDMVIAAAKLCRCAPQTRQAIPSPAYPVTSGSQDHSGKLRSCSVASTLTCPPAPCSSPTTLPLHLHRYKRGPLRRVQVALTHLDKVRDPADYRTRLMADYGPHAGSGGALGRYEPTASHLATPLTGGAGGGGAESAGGGGGGSAMFGLGGKGRQGGGGTSGSDMFGLGPPGASGGSGLLELQPAEGAGEGVGAATAAAAAVSAAASAAVAAATSGSGGGMSPMGFTPTSSRFRPPSLLQPSTSQRAGGGGNSSGGMPSTPSRLGTGQQPPGNTRLAPMSLSGQLPLKPMLPSLPITPGRPGGDGSAPATGSGANPADPAGGDVAAMWGGAGALVLAAGAVGASGAGGSLERRSRSVPAEGGSLGGGPPLHVMAPLAGSFSADASLAGAGQPPHHHHHHPPLTSSTSWAPMQTPPSMAARNRRNSGSAGGGSGSGGLPPPHPGHPTASATASSISLQASGLPAAASSSAAGAAAASTSTASTAASPYQPQFASTYQNPHFATTYQNPHFSQIDSAEARYLAAAAASAAAALSDAASSDGTGGGGAGSGSHQRLSTLSSAPAAAAGGGYGQRPGSSNGTGARPLGGNTSIPEPASLGGASPPGAARQGQWPGQRSTGGGGGSPLGPGVVLGGSGGAGPPRPFFGGAGMGSATPGSYGASGSVSRSMSPLRGVAATAAADAATRSGSASPARRREGLLGLSIAVPPSPGSEAEVTVVRMQSSALTPEGNTGGLRHLVSDCHSPRWGGCVFLELLGCPFGRFTAYSDDMC